MEYRVIIIDDDVQDSIFLIKNEIALEVNTGGYKYGLGEPNPCTDILKRYKELGGKLLTIGSDAHDPAYLAYEFSRLRELLISCGFSSYYIFKSSSRETWRVILVSVS